MGIHFITGWPTFNYTNQFKLVPLRNKAKWFESWLNGLEAGWTVHMQPNGLHSKEKWTGIQHLHMRQSFLVTSVPLCCTIFMANFSSPCGWPQWRVIFPMTHNQEVLTNNRYHFVHSMVGDGHFSPNVGNQVTFLWKVLGKKTFSNSTSLL